MNSDHKGNTNSTNTIAHAERIAKLSERLHGLQSHIQVERSSKQELLESRLSLIGDKISESHDNSKRKFNLLREHLGKIQKALEEEKNAREALTAQKEEEVRTLNEKLVGLVERQKQERLETENRLLRLLEERESAVIQEVRMETKQREDTMSQIAGFLENDVPKVNEMVSKEISEREAVDNRLLL